MFLKVQLLYINHQLRPRYDDFEGSAAIPTHTDPAQHDTCVILAINFNIQYIMRAFVFVYKLLNPLLDYSSKPTFLREVKFKERCKSLMRLFNTGYTVFFLKNKYVCAELTLLSK